MSTSGTTTFDLAIDDLIEEAYERCGKTAKSGNQLNSARRSLNLLFLDWSVRGLNLWTVEQASVSLTQGVNEITLPSDTVNVLEVAIRQSVQGTLSDTRIDRISREEWLSTPNKAVQARPSQCYVQRANPTKVFLYPAPDQSYTLLYYRIRRIQDAGAYTNVSDINFRFLPSLVSGLAYYLSLKFAPDRAAALKAVYEEDFQRVALDDRDNASARFLPDLGG